MEVARGAMGELQAGKEVIRSAPEAECSAAE